MKKEISRRSFVTQMGIVGAAAGGGLVLPEAQVHGQPQHSFPGPNPDPQYVKSRTRGFEVWPNGVDDRDNLEWALRNTPPGGTVKLVPGTYKIGSTIVVPDFDGRLIGAGARETTLTCTDEHNYELWEAPGGGKASGESKPPPFPRKEIDGSSTKTAPGLVLFYKTPLQAHEDPMDRANRIEIRDLRCRGAMLGDDWMFGEDVLCFTIINSMDWHHPESVQITTRQDVVISGVDVDGYETDQFGAFGNACSCIAVLGSLMLTADYNLSGVTDGDALGRLNGGMLGIVPAEGDVTIRNCKLTNCRLGPAIVGYKNGNLLFENMSTDGCRADCLRLLDNSNCDMQVRNCDLFCDSFALPPDLAVGGATDQPSSIGCIVAIQGLTAALGVPNNVQWRSLAVDPVAHEGHPEAGPIGTWRPLGPAFAPAPSTLTIVDNSCQSSLTPSTYCYHVADLSNFAFGMPSVEVTIKNNACRDSETCISLEHVDQGLVKNNDCSSQAFGVELHNSPAAQVAGNSFSFPPGANSCEIRVLALGEKIDLSRVVPGAGMCFAQG